MRKQYQTAKGVPVNVDDMISAGQDSVALGNLGGANNVNARGDVLGKAGNVVKKREEVVPQYYAEALPERMEVPLSQTTSEDIGETFLSPSEAMDKVQKMAESIPKKKTTKKGPTNATNKSK